MAANDSGTLHLTIRNPTDDQVKGVVEAREYPLHVYRKPAPPAPRMPRPEIRREQPPFPPPNLEPMTPPNKEVTVIRGTEKTRVVLPNDE